MTTEATPPPAGPLLVVAAANESFRVWGLYDRKVGSGRPFKMFAILDGRDAAADHARSLQSGACQDRDMVVFGAVDERSLPEALPAEAEK